METKEWVIDTVSRTPLWIGGRWSTKTGYLVVDMAVWTIWCLQLISPSEWLFSLYKQRGRDAQYHTKPLPVELFVILVLIGASSLLRLAELVSDSAKPYISAFLALLIVDICRDYIYRMLVRPAVDPNYIQYNGARTFLLAILSYINISFLFANIFFLSFQKDFSTNLTPAKALATSIGYITTSGVSGVSPNGDVISIVSSVEALVGVLFAVAIIAIAISRNRTIVSDISNEP